ncbi:MAG: hypothetical protein EZS28_006151 [Streblomastix strix]|uniref:Uncharacterized protein n=1 Tax=Streblomastix strix TaxID=222440 RepID=A0A5J4WTT6_9EUKA|nr:MAG: hypothetical protein EZS28_006151 [Streblomastix strix]
MRSVYIDEALMNALGLFEFPELYTNIYERKPKPVIDEIANQIIFVPQYLQYQLKDKVDKLIVRQTLPEPIIPLIPIAAEITSLTLFAGMIQINGIDTLDVVVNQRLGFYPMDLCDFIRNYLIDTQPQEQNQNNISSNGEPIYYIDSVIMQHDTLLSVSIPLSVFPQYTVPEVSRDQLLALTYIPYDIDAFKIYITDNSINKLVKFNMHFRQKGFIKTKRYILIGDTDNPVRLHIDISSELKADKLCLNFVVKLKVLSANMLFDNKFEGFEESYKDGTVLFIGLKSVSQIIGEYTIYHRIRTIDGTLQNACGTYVTMRDIEESIEDQVSIQYTMPIRFRLSISLDHILIFSAYIDHSNSLFGDLKIKFKINSNTFEFVQVNQFISMAKYYIMNKTDLMASGPDKLKSTDLLFRNWSLRYQYTKQFTEMRCTADLITTISMEQLTDRGQKNLICNISRQTLSIKNYVVTEVTANMSRYKAKDDCLQRVREFYANRPFVVPSQRVEAWSFPTSATTTGIRTSQNIPLSHVTGLCLLFPKDARATTCYENPCYHNMQVTTCDRNFFRYANEYTRLLILLNVIECKQFRSVTRSN